MTLPEVVLWSAIRRRVTGARFRRQHALGPYILDFYCPAARLAVEVDGIVHEGEGAARHDARRDAWLASKGVRVLRFPASSVLRDEELEGVIEAIVAAAAPSTSFAGPPPPLGG
jgi:very-short-patch-repair endonuclease